MTNPRQLRQLAITSAAVVALWASLGASSGHVLHFSAEDESVPDAVRLPVSALKILAADTQVKRTMQYRAENTHESGDQLPHSLFSARIVHLNGRDERDFIVMGVGYLRGANVNPFWVLQPTPSGYKVILTVAAHDLEIREGFDYPDITAHAATAVQVHTMKFRFRNGMYRLHRGKWEDIK